MFHKTNQWHQCVHLLYINALQSSPSFTLQIKIGKYCYTRENKFPLAPLLKNSHFN